MRASVSLHGVALDELWREHGVDLLRFAALLVGPHDADDIAVEAFVGAAVNATDPAVRDPRRYLLGAVANHAASFRRSRERRWRRDLAAVVPSSTSAADDFAEVRHAVARLTVAQRSVVYFAFWEDLPEREIAELLGVSPGTVHRNLYRAKLLLRKALQ
jgi:RNA polymerase sigma-70 factor (ECF subfamily)